MTPAMGRRAVAPAGRRLRPALALGGALALAGALFPASAGAHGISGKADLPIPSWLFAWGAALVLVVSFVALGALWRKPLLDRLPERVLLGYPRWLEIPCGAVGIAIFVLFVYAGFAGNQDPNRNFDPTFFFVIFWVGLPFASVLFGDVFRAFNPWRAAGRAAGWLVGAVRSRPVAHRPYPEWLGRWPAVAGILSYAWVELVYTGRTKAQALAIIGLIYAGLMLAAIATWGSQVWTERGDGFSVYFGLFARLSPLHWQDGELRRRAIGVGVTHLDLVPGTVPMLAAMIGSTSFDGLGQTSVWTNVEPHIQDLFSNLGLGQNAALELAYSVGLVVMVGLIGGLYRLGIEGMRTVDHQHGTDELATRFVHSLVPIALAYLVAHYFSLLLFQGQAMGYLVSDPLGKGSNLFGTAHARVDLNLISTTWIWYVQVAALVVGHAAGLTFAHDRALVIYDRVRAATRSQYWMLAVMVGFTSLGLWLLSARS
ncbi:MAG: fenitrothion hydrolase [Actinobacteria bacterium]|nr:MAG: fenitrothion hydrolase [Actinomycetota bacterium]